MGKKIKKYTGEQFERDKKKLIGAGLLIMAGIVVLLHFWNMDLIATRKQEREKVVQYRAERGIEMPTMPAISDFQEMFDQKLPQIFEKKLADIEKPIITEKFENFEITLSPGWQKVEEEKLKEMPELKKQLEEMNVNLLFSAHNFSLERMVMKFMKQGNIGIGDWGTPGLSEISIDKIIENVSLLIILDAKKITPIDFENKLKEVIKQNKKYFEVIEFIPIIKEEKEIGIRAEYLLLAQEEDIEDIRIYSHKRIILINENLYAFIFLSSSKVDEYKMGQLNLTIIKN